MAWIFLFTAVMMWFSCWLINRQTIRNYVAGAWSRTRLIARVSADTLLGYLIICGVVMGFIAIFFALGLAVRGAGAENVGNGIITLSILLVGVPLLVLTFFLNGIVRMAAEVLATLKGAITNINLDQFQNATTKEVVEAVLKMIPEENKFKDLRARIKSWGEEASRFFSPEQLIAILSAGPHLVYQSMDSITKTINSMFSWVMAGLLWLFVAGFVGLALPGTASTFWILFITYGVLLLTFIALYKGQEWREKYKLPDLYWLAFRGIRLAVVVGVAVVILGVLHAALTQFSENHLPHWVVGFRNWATIQEEQSAKDQFGQNYDQRIWRADGLVTGYAEQRHGLFDTRLVPQDVALNSLLWKTKEPEREMDDELTYGLYMLPVPNRRMLPDQNRKVWVPVSRVSWAQDVAPKKVELARGTEFYPDSSGHSSYDLHHFPMPYVVEILPGETEIVIGEEVTFARTYDPEGNIYDMWVKGSFAGSR